MAVTSRLLSLFTLSSLAVLICSLQSTPVSALSIESPHARSMHNRGHDALAKRKRSTKKNKRCKPISQSSSSAAAEATSTSSSYTAAPTSSSSSSAPAPSSSSSGNDNKGGSGGLPSGGSKAGLGWPNGESDLSKWKGISTIYTWNPACPSNAAALGITCCPMLWGSNQASQFEDEVNKNPPKCAMGMNEPEIPGQSNINAQDGANMWNQHLRPLKAKYGTTLMSPSCTSDPAGKQWYKDFFAACGATNDDKCGVDKLALHWYDVSGDALISYLEDMYSTFNLPLWLTEFACQNFNGGAQCSQDQVWSFATQVTAYMNSASFMETFMPFGAMRDMQGVNGLNQLMDGSGAPNALAKAYLGL